ncbi:MAG TPA: c-type cytochrome [Polyangia bacterium]|nr:c-type cytochrome [Polyangia bacterium]
MARGLLGSLDVRTSSERLSTAVAAVVALVVVPHAAVAADAAPSSAAVMFAKKCGGCHTLGEGDRTGPDLLGVTKRRSTKWLVDMVRGAGALIDAGDPTATDLLAKFKNVRMPDQALPESDVVGLIDYVRDCTGKGGCKLALGPIRNAREAKPAEVAQGRELFVGERPFAAGAPACISCHGAGAAGRLILGAGTLARDLGDAYARLGDQALNAAIANAPFPLMSQIFPQHPLTDAEVFQVKAFLAVAGANGGAAPGPDRNFLYLGVIGAVLSLGLAGAVWRDRARGVRGRLVARARAHAPRHRRREPADHPSDTSGTAEAP